MKNQYRKIRVSLEIPLKKLITQNGVKKYDIFKNYVYLCKIHFCVVLSSINEMRPGSIPQIKLPREEGKK